MCFWPRAFIDFGLLLVLTCSLPTGARFLEDGLVVPGQYTAFSNDKTMVTILHRELERKVETKNNVNFQPE